MKVEGLARRLHLRREQASAYGVVDMGGGRTLPAEDVLDGHFNRVAATRSTRNVSVQLGPDLQVAITVLAPSLAPLTNLAEDLVDVVPRVEPAAQFRRELHKALEATYRQHAAQRTLGTRPIAQIDENGGPFRIILWIAPALLALVALYLFLSGNRDRD